MRACHRNECESSFVSFVCMEGYLRKWTRSPTVVTADARLTEVDTYLHVILRDDVVDVCLSA